MTFKCLVLTEASERFIVRFYPPARASVIACEPDLLTRCHRAGIPVPQVLLDSRTGPKASLSYIAYRMLEGDPLSDRLPTLTSTQQKILAADLAQRIFNLSRIEFQGFGELTSSETARESSWTAFVAASFQRGLAAIRNNSLLPVDVIQQLDLLTDRIARLQEWHASNLVWGDIHFENILVDPSGRIAGLVDFESCLSGDPLATLGYCFAAQGACFFSLALFDAWPAKLPADQRERALLYAILRGLRLAPYAHLPLPTGAPRDSLPHIFPGFLSALSTLANAN
jgi:aminoglycoside phosphotransferase (APT) family kinase protein